MTPVSLEHIRQLQVLLLRMRAYLVTPSKDNIMRCEQLGYGHMALTGKGPVYLEEYDDGVELTDDKAYRLVHKHFRDLTYNYLAGNSHLTAADVIARFDEQLASYALFLAEHIPPVTLDEPYQPREWYRGADWANIVTVRLITPHGGRARLVISTMPHDRPNRELGACLHVFHGADDQDKLRDVFLWAANFALDVAFEINPYERITEFLMDPDYFERFGEGWRP